MNDDFLNTLRRDPPPQFARRLQQRLQAQEAQSKRRRTWSLRTLLFLIVGSAFAGGMLVLERRSSSEDPEAAESQSQITAAKQAAAGYRPRYLGPGFVPERNGGAGSDRFGDSPPTAASSSAGLAAQPGQTTQSTAGFTSGTSEQTSNGGLIRSRATPPSVAISPVADALIRSALSRHTYKKFEEPRLQAMPTEDAFSGFCAPGNARQFDVVVASRRISHAEFMKCRDNGVNRIRESKLGYQALVLTSARDSAPVKLSASDVYLAVARIIPDPADPTRLIDNTNFTWDQVNGKLAYRPIAVFGPASDTPLRLLFETLLLDPGCNVQRVLEAPQLSAPDRQAEICHSIRTDRLYSEVEQSASLIPQNLWSDPHGFVLVDYAFYLANQTQLGGSALEGPEPSSATFADGTYPLALPIYLYVDETRMDRAVAVHDDLQDLRSHGLSGPNRFGFVRLDASEASPRESWRRKPPLTESDLINERSTPR
jgi:phosphate transport system substrate-binding protein